MKLTKLLLAITALAVASCCESAKGATTSYQLNTITSGATPLTPAPWATFTFTDVGLNQVKLDITSSLTNGEFFSKMALNVNPGLTVTDSNLVFAFLSQTGSFDLPTINIDYDNVNVGAGGGSYDISMDFETSSANGGSRRFNESDNVSYLMTYTGQGTFNSNLFAPDTASAHIQAIGNDSAWTVTSIPEPSATLLGGLGVLALLRRKRH